MYSRCLLLSYCKWHPDWKCQPPTCDVINGSKMHPDLRWSRSSLATQRLHDYQDEEKENQLPLDDDVIKPHFRFVGSS